jgi:hypothetical protein
MTASSSVVLSNLAYLVGAVVLAIIGGLVVWLRHRQPKSVDANVESFHRGLRALAPDAANAAPPPQPVGLTGAAGLRIQPRVVGDPRGPGTDPGPGGAESDDGAAELPGEVSSAVEDPGQEPGTRAVIVDLSRQDLTRPDPAPRQQRAAPGDGTGDRAGAETG